MPQFKKSRATIVAGLILLLIPASSFSQKTPIAVLDFDAFGISDMEAAALSNRLRNELFRLGRFNVVDRGMMENILEEQDFQQTGCTSNDCLVEVGKILGAQQMVGGSVSKVGDTFTVSARLVDVASGQLLAVSDFDLRGELDDLLTRGMGQVAAMLSHEDDAINEAALAESPPADIEPRVIAEPPVTEATSTASHGFIQGNSVVGLDFSVLFGRIRVHPNGNIRSIMGLSPGLGLGYKKYFGQGASPQKFSLYWTIGTDAIVLPYFGIGVDYIFPGKRNWYLGVNTIGRSASFIGSGPTLNIGMYLP